MPIDVSKTHDPVETSRTRRRWLIWSLTVGATVAISLAMMLLWPYSTREFRGDGQIADTGFWTYPRYHVTFPRISLTKPGEYVFRCSGLPPKPLTFVLQIDGKGNYDVLSSLNTIVDVRLSMADGHTVGQVSGALRDWVLQWRGDNSGAFWDRRLRDLKLKRNQEYTLTILVKRVDSESPPLEVQPTFTGGGNELP